MAESPTQKIAALAGEVGILRADLEARTHRIASLERDLKATEVQVADLRAKLSNAEAHCAALQRLSDRGWNLSQAVLVVALTTFASVAVQLALRK